ncbi:MAG: hypothetical protein AAF385_14225 [Pseudomonadota bacterium]
MSSDRDANLIYQLDCISLAAACNRANFDELWQSFELQSRDEGWLDRWRKLRIGRASVRFTTEPAGLASHPLDLPLHRENVSEPSLSAEEYAILARFSKRFDRWWLSRANEHGLRMSRGLKHQAARARLPEKLEALANFYRIDELNAADVSVELISAPAHSSLATHAEIRGSDAYLETLIGETASARIGVLAHELAHYYYANTHAELRLDTRRWFLENENFWAITAYSLFNEAIAAAFGNGLIEQDLNSKERFAQLLQLPESFYADTYVDLAAKACLPLLREYLSEGRALDKAFVDRYIAAVRPALDSHMGDLGLWLRNSVYGATSATLEPLSAQVHGYFRTGAFLSERLDYGCQDTCLMQVYPELSGILVTRTNRLDQLADLVPSAELTRIRREILLNGHAVFGLQRSPRSLVFIVSGDTDSAVEAGLQRLLRNGQIFVGLLES